MNQEKNNIKELGLSILPHKIGSLLNYDKSMGLDADLREIIKQYSRKEALVFSNKKLTYQELDEAINKITTLLLKKIDDQSQIIGIYLSRGIEQIITVLAILRAGHAYLPLDISIPELRLTTILNESNVSTVITNENLQGKIPKEIRKIKISESINEIEQFPLLESRGQNPAYIIYTSGSTGQPKGVVIQQHSVRNLVQSMRDILNIDHNSRILQFADLSFDVSVCEIFTALLSGATLVIANDDQRHDLNALLNLLEKESVSLCALPAAFLSLVPYRHLPELKTLIASGDVNDPKTLNRWLPHVNVVNAYGPTETTVCATLAFYTSEMHSNNLGEPIHNTYLYVLDENLKPVQAGEEGELFIGGAGLAIGYYQDEIKTHNQFIHNFFSKDQNERLYKTGDRVQYSEDKQLIFLGRSDRQIKLRGFRIDLDEIESTLRNLTELKQVAIICYIKEQDKRIICFYSTDNQQIDDDVLKTHLVKSLPEYMLPSRFFMKKTLPLTNSGKIDRQVLLNELEQSFMINNQCSDSLSLSQVKSSEDIIVSCFTKVLKISHMNADDNFFTKGGNSLLAVELIYKLNQQLGTGITMKAFFENPTINGILTKIKTVPVKSINENLQAVEEF